MSKRSLDFLTSVGIMVLGVGLVFLGSVTFTAKPVAKIVESFPLVKAEPFQVGGDVVSEVLPISHPTIPLLSATGTEYKAPLTSVVVLAVDDQTNTVLFDKNSEEVRSLASITKLMSGLVLREMNIDWSTTTMVTEDDTDPSSHHLIAGEAYKMDDLWKIALIGSSNSAIRTMVRNSGLTEEEFAIKMNEKAEALGLNSLRFVEPTGLDSRNMGKASDILRLLKLVLKNDQISEALKIPQYFAEPLNKKVKHQVWNTNWLLTNWVPNKFDKDVLVGKTGFIDQSGYNLVVRIPGDKSHVIRIVVLGAATNEERFSEARDVSEWIFKNYIWPDDEGYSEILPR